MNASILRGALIAASLFSACTTPHWYDYRFTPTPLEVQVGLADDANAQVRALVSVLGIARPHEDRGPAVVIRMRLENLGSVPAELDDDSLVLVSGDLQAFGKAELPVDPVPPISPGGDVTHEIRFPLPPGLEPKGLDLSGLNLRWTMLFEGRRVTTGATFQRMYYDPYYNDPNYHVGFGIGYVHYPHCH